ncbi:MAG: MATE family efflux transporter [Oscillospiraceae bacterium]|jgi:putative MATE family efflux protein|nr:MATE family efflux transporter [Oscillospiraceae bacterium]
MNEAEPRKENKMGVMPVNKLLVNMSLPLMASMLMMSLYNIVDSIFVSRISESALTAVSLAFPAQQLITALGVGTGVGLGSYLSRSLGEKKYTLVNKIAENGIFLSWMFSLLFALLGIFAVRPFFATQTDNGVILEYGVQYLTPIFIGSFFVFSQITNQRILLSTGRTLCTMIAQATGAVVNCLLDPIFIFGYFGVPRLEVRGAAIATIIGQIVGAALAFGMNKKLNSDVHLDFKGFKPDPQIIKGIFKVGAPSILMQSVGSVMVFFFNMILMMFTETAVAVFGIYFKLQSFIFMPVFGMNNGIVAIVAYNFGAQNKKRITDTIKLGLKYSGIVMSLGLALFMLAPKPLLLLFDASPQMLAIGVPALRIISVHFVLAAMCVVLVSVFQAFGNGMYSLIVSLSRQIGVLLPVAWILSLFGNVNYVWWAFPIAEMASLVLCLAFTKKIYNNKIATLGVIT